jgi:hypothetical protein
MSKAPYTPEQLELQADIRKQYPHLVAREEIGKPISNTALGAKNIKRLLSKEFPGVKFRVGSDLYAGGSTINVSWDGYTGTPDSRKVDAIIHENFAYQRFDGMTDSTNYDNDPWRTQFRALFGSSGYVHAQANRVSPEEQAARDTENLQKQTPSATKQTRGMRL